MQPYQNFFTPQMPVYNQQFPNNPYADRMANLQQFQQSLQQPIQQPTIGTQFPAIGKIVESIDIVKATDIPMDGTMYYFPTADGSAVYGKQWLPNGQTRILPFKPVLEPEAENTPIDSNKSEFGEFRTILDGIQNDIQIINEKIDKFSKPAPANKQKKEVVADE